MIDPPKNSTTNPERSNGLGYVRANDCWHCTVSEPEKKCDSVPTQKGNCPRGICQPTASTNRYRVNIHWLLTLMAVAGFAGLFSTNWQSEFIAAGPLSSPHAQILGGQFGSERCQQCHVDSDTIASLAMTEAMVGGHHTSQSSKCMVCHTNKMPNLERSSPHDLTESTLMAIGQQHFNSSSVRLVSASTELDFNWKKRDLGCGDCHREHNGARFDLQAISDRKCQSCHQQTFDSFETSHPEFENYPPARIKNIMFDHVRHRDLHFAKSSASFDCKKCHLETDQVTAVGAVTPTVSFEAACAQCHQDAMESSLSQGVVVFQLPSLDARQLPQLQQLDWPVPASQLNDGTVPPVMQLLLRQAAVDSDWSDWLPDKGRLDRFDFSKLRDRRAAMGLAIASKELLSEIAAKGQLAIQNRLTRLSRDNSPPANRARFVTRDKNSFNPNHGDSNHLSPALIQDLMAGIPPQVFEAALNEWFPEHTSTQLHVSGHVIRQQPSLRQPSKKTFSGTVAGRLRPPVSADREMREPISHFRQVASQDSLLDDDVDLLDDNLLNVEEQTNTESLLDDEGLLGEASGDDLLSSDSLLDDSLLSDNEFDQQPSGYRESEKRIQIDSYVSAGGWFIDNRRMAIIYKPTGHADHWLAAWTQLAAALARDSDDLLSGQELLDHKFAGNCAECHQSGLVSSENRKIVFQQHESETDRLDSSRLKDVWKSVSISATKRFLTRFDHTPHLLLPGLTDCAGCHVTIESNTDLLAAGGFAEQGKAAADRALIADQEFQSISVATCQQCHQKDAASANCTTCHNYHVDQIRNLKDL